MSQTLTPDLCIIGAGSAGLSVAAGAAQMGAAVVLVERDRMGGDCLNVGCVPSKSLIAAAAAAHAVRDGGRFGVGGGEPRVDFAAVRRHVRGVIAGIAPHDGVERFEGLGVRVLRASARFTGRGEVTAGGQIIRARRFVVATGSRPTIPPVSGLAELAPLTNETVFDLDALPERLLILGGGPIGCELAQAFRRLGSGVDLVDQGPILPREDPELAGVVRDRLAAEGVRLHERVEVTAAASGPELWFKDAAGEQRLRGSHLLVAAGRRAQIEDLGLDAAGIAADAKGIKVDARLRTTNARVFAIGDVAGGPQFTHLASHHAGIVIRNALFRLPARADRQALPRVTYTDPELAVVGLSEAEAAAAGTSHRVLRWPFAENDRARAEARTEGLIKLVVGRRGRLLGAGIAGAHAGELILPYVLALDRGLPLSAMAGAIVPYPTLGEVGKRAAGSWYATALYGPRTRRLVRLLAKLG